MMIGTRASLVMSMLFGLFPGLGLAQPKAAPSTAFFYGHDVPRELATAYEQIVVQPEHAGDPARIARHGAQPVAYFSVGELAPSQAENTPATWVLERNRAWASLVMDLANADYRAHALARYEALWSRGYRRFFLDTLDSYQLAAKTDAARARQQQGLVALIRSMKSKHPDVQLWLNRGFEILPEVAAMANGIVAESLFDRWDAGKQAYTRVPEADRAWLLGKLREARDRHRLPVIVIDYRPESEREAARATARKIVELGFEPWVCNGMLSDLGVGRYEVFPRRVLMLTDTPVKDGAPLERGPLGWLAPVLEHLGYFAEIRSVHAGLPDTPLVGRYAGVISWFNGASLPNGYAAWVARQARSGTRFALFGALGIDPGSDEARELGLRPAHGVELHIPGPGNGAVLQRDALIGFEAAPPHHPIAGGGLRLEGPSAVAHLQVLDQRGQRADAVATTSWGGIAVSHVFALRGLAGERAWVLDPFAFLTRALRLPAAPVPDVTTEHGRRLALFAVESDGVAEPARLRGRPLTWSVLRDAVLAKHPWPHALRTSPDASDAERDAVSRLLRLPAVYEAGLAHGETDLRGAGASLTRLQAMAQEGAGGLEVPAPIAWDAAFVPPGAEAYPYQHVIETLQLTEAPRRLKPAALHYHAYLASSPAGLEALLRVYAWLEAQEVLPIRVADYIQRVRAFREQVLVRELDGAWSTRGGDALRTLRVPGELGSPNVAASAGVESVRSIAQGTYVTFAASGPRRLSFEQKTVDMSRLARKRNGS